MTKNENLNEEKIKSDDGIGEVEGAVTGEGGEVEKRLADLKKEVDPKADSLKEEKEEKEEDSEKKEEEEEDSEKKENPFVKEEKDAGTEEEEDGDEKDSEKDSEDDEKDSDEDRKEVKEESALFTVFEGIDLSDETKRKISLVFETAVESKAEKLSEEKSASKIAEIQETFENKYKLYEQEQETKFNLFLEETQKEWLDENKLVIEDNNKVALAESLIDTIKILFLEHGVTIEEDAKIVVEDLEEKLQESVKTTEKVILENIELNKKLELLTKENVFSEICEGLTTSQAEKLRALSSKIVMEDEDTFKNDLKTIKESFFPTKSKVLVEEEVVTQPLIKESQEKVFSTDPTVNQIIQAINARKNL